MNKNVVYACDDSYVPIFLASLASLLESNNDVTVYLLFADLAEENRVKIDKCAGKYGKTILYIDVNGAQGFAFGSLKMSNRWPPIVCVRLWLENLLPPDIKMILYLDCDTIIVSDLSELYSVDLDGYAAAGVLDCMDKRYKKRIGLSQEDPYLNSGVLLFHLEFMRKIAAMDRFQNAVERFGEKFKYPDQDAINLGLKGYLKKLPLKYNVIAQILAFEYMDYLRYRNSAEYYEKTEFDNVESDTAVYHFTSGFAFARPWYGNCQHPQKDLFRQYYLKANGSFENWGIDDRSDIQQMVSRWYRKAPGLLLPFLKIMRYVNNR